MQIDPNTVHWDGPDPSTVKWDDEKPKKGTGSDAADAGNAVATGYFRGMTRLLGLPADTAMNVVDLGKAGLGSAYTAVTGKPAPDALQLGDRANVIGSGDWLLNQVRKIGAGRLMVDPVNPEYEGGYLQNAGGALNSLMRPNTWAQAVQQFLLGQTSAAAGKATYDATGNPALAVTASLAPQGAVYYGTEGVKRLVRGGEKGRQEMAQRVKDLENAGIEEPTLGLASGNKFIGGVENLLQNTPGAVGVMQRSRDKAVEGLRNKTAEAADLASTRRSSLDAGRAIQSGITDFKEGFKTKQRGLYDKLESEIGSQTPTPVENTRQAFSKVNEDIPGAPELSKFFKNSRIQSLQGALESDVTNARAYSPSQIKAALDKNPQTMAELNKLLNEETLPFEAVKKTRTLVGNELADHSLMSDVPRSKWNPLYGALSKDMGAAAKANGAESTFNRASNHTRAGMDRLDMLRPFADKSAPEQAFTSLMQTTRENGSVLQAVKKSLPEGARGVVAGTVIERLGKANPGNQNDLGEKWSSERFLTNWNTMSPKARNELFSGFPNAAKVKADVEAVAKATSMMRDNSKMWANPSGTGAATAARAVLFGTPLSFFFDPTVALGGAGLLGGARLAGHAVTNRGVIDAMARQSLLSPEAQMATFNSLATQGLLQQQ